MPTYDDEKTILNNKQVVLSISITKSLLATEGKKRATRQSTQGGKSSQQK